MAWQVETLNAVVDDEIGALPNDMQAAFLRLSERIEAVGLERLREPHVRHLRGNSGKCALAVVGVSGGRST